MAPLDRLKAVPLLRVLHTYGLLDGMVERRSVAVGSSPFNEVGVLRANLKRNLWDDTGGRPIVSGSVVSGDVVGLVQAIEDVPVELALALVRERFVRESRAGTARMLTRVAGLCKPNRPVRQELGGLACDVPFLRRVGVRPEVAKAWGVGWCPRGKLRGRIVFPVRRPDATVVGYAGLDPDIAHAGPKWQYPKVAELELFGIHRVYLDEHVRKVALDHGLTLVDDPLEAVRMARLGALPVVSPMSASLSDAQLAMLLDPAINPTGRLIAAGESRRGWELAVRRFFWRQRADRFDRE